MHPHLVRRLEAIRKTLVAHYEGAGLPNPTIGAERQNLVDRFLREVLPPIYRFGSGVIVDSAGKSTGALDVVVELPFAPNFPLVAGDQRLYLAESVGAVLEVKSDLYKQWNEAVGELAKVKALNRNCRTPHRMVLESSPDPVVEHGPRLPCYVVSYTGHTTIDGVRNRRDETPEDCRPDGVLVVESGVFVGSTGEGEGAEGLFRFVAELVAHVNAATRIAYPDLLAYL